MAMNKDNQKNSKVAKKRISGPRVKKDACYQLKIVLSDAPLPIWRRLVVRSDVPLSLLHQVFQIAMGWWDYHLYDFESKGRHFGDLDTSEGDEKVEDADKFCLSDLISEVNETFKYHYDFGDSWHHEVTLEDILPPRNVPRAFALCVGGRRACPPEDVGGVDGYANFLNIIEDNMHPERLEHLIWAGGDFDPDSFDIRGVNLRLELFTEAIALGMAEPPIPVT